MGRVNVDNLEKGMVLDEDVKSGSQILLTKGVKISNKHITIFKSWGVNSVEIIGVCEQDLTNLKLGELAPEVREKLEKELKEKFLHVDFSFHPAQVLFNTCLLNNIK